MFRYQNKTNFKTVLSILLISQCLACEEKLNVEPAQSISKEVALGSENNIKAVLNGAYDVLGSNSLYGGGLLFCSELLGGDGEIFWAGFANSESEIFRKEINVVNFRARNIWQLAYRSIHIVNQVLGALDQIVSPHKNTIEGEALFIRGVLYFELVRLYGAHYQSGQENKQLGVPLLLENSSNITEKDFVPRATVQAIYLQLVQDLERAESLLPAANGWRASGLASAAILSRVHLQMGEFALARDAAHRVINANVHQLEAEYASIFNRDNNSTEDIFAIQNTVQDGTNSMNQLFSTAIFGGGDGYIEILKKGHLDLYEAQDERKALFFFQATGVDTSWYSGKWNHRFGNIGIVRLAEMHLTRAECNQRLNTNIGASPLADYNLIHTRAGLTSRETVTLADILLERRLELAHEGQKIHEIKRLQLQLGDRPYTDLNLVFPIPEREINVNPLLIQNQGY